MLTEEQKILRLQGLGGSDIAAVFGISPYRTPYELWEEKAMGYINHEDNEDLAFRSYLEPAVADMYRHRTKRKLTESDGMVFHPKFPWLFANPDRLIYGEKGILEIKTTRQFKSAQFGEEGTDHIPFEYLLQVAHYCMCLDYDFCDIAVLFGDFTLKIFHYKRNRAIESQIVQKTRDFWLNHVVPKVPPEYTTQDDLDKLYRSVSGKTIEANEAQYNLYIEYNKLNKQMKPLVARMEEIKQQLKLYVKDAETMTYNGNRIIKTTEYNTTTLSTAVIKKEYPHLFDKHKTISKRKRFTIVEVKDDE